MDKRGDREHSLLLAAIFLFWFSVYTYPSFLSDYSVTALGAGKLMAGMIVGSYGLVQMLLRLPLGIMSDALRRRKPFVLIGFLCAMIASAGLFVLSLLVDTGGARDWMPGAAVVLRGIAGIAASTWVTLSVLFSSHYPPNMTGLAMSRLLMPQYAAQASAMLLGAQLAQRVGPAYSFALATVAGAAGLAVMWRASERPPEGEPITVRALSRIVTDRDLIAGTALATLLQLIFWATIQGFVQNWAREVCQLSTGQLGYLSVTYLIPNMLISRISGGYLAKKMGRAPVVSAGFALMGGACALYPATRDLAGLLAVQALFGVGLGLVMPLTMSAAIANIPDAGRGVAMGVYQAVYGLGMFLGPVLAGAIIERFSDANNAAPGYVANFYIMAGMALVGVLAAWPLLGRRTRAG